MAREIFVLEMKTTRLRGVFPTIIQYIVILLIVIASLPFALVGLAQIPFLPMEVSGYFPSALYMLISTFIGATLAIPLYFMLQKQISPKLVFAISYILSFAAYYFADELIEGVNIPIYMELLFALVSNNLSNINTIQKKENQD